MYTKTSANNYIYNVLINKLIMKKKNKFYTMWITFKLKKVFRSDILSKLI